MVETELLLKPESPRERILRATAELCAEFGCGSLEARLIAERAGLEEDQVRKAIGGVEECMLALMSATIAQVLAEVSGSYSPDRSESESGLLGMLAILELMAANPAQAYFAYIAARQMAPGAVSEAYRGGNAVLASMVERLGDGREATPQPRGAARAAVGGAEALVRREIAEGRGKELPGLLPDLAYGATVPFLGQEEAMRLAREAQRLLAGTPWG